MNRTSALAPEGGGHGPHIDEDLCLDLLHNLLAPAEKEKVLAHLAICPPCEGLFRKTVAERERLRATRVLQSLPGGRLILGSAGETVPTQQTKARARRLWGSRSQVLTGLLAGFRQRARFRLAVCLGVVAAALLLVIWSGRQGAPDVPLPHWLPTHFEKTRSRTAGAAVPNEELAAGLEAYAAQDLKRAIGMLEKAQVSEQLEMVRRIYLGSALAWSGKYAEAAAVLKAIPRTLPDPWGSEALWTLHIALKGSGREAAADSLLRSLAEEPGEIGERARRFLQQ